jgi:hypothetical protein
MTRRDEFDDDDTFLDAILRQKGRTGHPGSLRRVLAVTAGLAVLGVLGAVLWSTVSDDPAVSNQAVPIIRADANPYKVVPDEPGGMAVPNKDSTIFETLKGQQQKSDQARLENLFEDAEKPVRKDEVFAASEAVTPAEPPPAAKEVVSKMPKMPTVTYESAEASDATPPVNLRPPQPTDVAPVAAAPAPATKPKEEPAEEIAAAAPKAAAIQPAAGGNFYVQMAAVKSESDARKQWPAYQAKYNQLSDLQLRVQQADLGAKGIYYRIQGGPLTEADARKVCSSINAQKSGSCVVAKR